MEFRMPSYYKDFKCIADRCPDTCCAGWAIVIDNRTMEKYAHMQGLKGNYVRRHVDFKERVYKREGARCTFFIHRGFAICMAEWARNICAEPVPDTQDILKSMGIWWRACLPCHVRWRRL